LIERSRQLPTGAGSYLHCSVQPVREISGEICSLGYFALTNEAGVAAGF
jgi:hypothetical protein